MIPEKQIDYYETESGKKPVQEWLLSLDRDFRNRIDNRLIRVSVGNYGDCDTIKTTELKELRFHFGKGYRIYFAEVKNKIILLLTAGNKDSQFTDIKKAQEYWEDYKNRKGL